MQWKVGVKRSAEHALMCGLFGEGEEEVQKINKGLEKSSR